MNVFIKITLSSLKKNRTRTIVTIIGVILSVAMITAVTTLIASLQSFMIRNVIATDGDWHIQFMEADSALVQRLSADNEVAAAAVSQNIGYAVLEGGQNENKPYLFVAGFDDKAMEMNVFTKLRYPAKVYKFAQSAGGGSGYTYNNDLLRYMGISKDETFNAVLYRLGGIFILLIMLGSILLIHNSFSISVAERTANSVSFPRWGQPPS